MSVRRVFVRLLHCEAELASIDSLLQRGCNNHRVTRVVVDCGILDTILLIGPSRDGYIQALLSVHNRGDLTIREDIGEDEGIVATFLTFCSVDNASTTVIIECITIRILLQGAFTGIRVCNILEDLLDTKQFRIKGALILAKLHLVKLCENSRCCHT